MKKKSIIAIVAIIVVIVLLFAAFTGFFGEQFQIINKKPVVHISYPADGATVSSLVMISGTASDPDASDNVTKVEIKINDQAWKEADGTALWSVDWTTYGSSNGRYTITARSYDGKDYSDEVTISVVVNNPENVDSVSHKWAIFIAAANFPENNASKLGNGGLNLAEQMADYFIEKEGYATSRIWILFDDGWIRADNGLGAREMTLQQRHHTYDITYGGATQVNVKTTIQYMINESNAYSDSEVFLWIFNHGTGELNRPLFGGKLFQSSEILLWDYVLSDKELGQILSPLQSKKTTVLIDACYAGGFADKTILNIHTSLLFRSKIPRSGRIVISATSKFRTGYASTTQGPVFSYLWFMGLKSGEADGFKAGLFHLGVQRHLRFFKNGVVSVEEAYYYARYMLRTDDTFKEFKSMQPQINDQYPRHGFLLSYKELVL